MQHGFIIFACLALNFGPAFGYVYSTQSLCKTFFGKTSTTPVKTSSYAVTLSLTYQAKTTVTPTVIVTPPATSTSTTTTTTTTTTVNTTPSGIITQTLTATSTETDTETDTLTTTTTTTTTTTPAAVVIPTSAGFTPLASASGYMARKRSLNEVVADAVPAIRGRTVAARAAANSICRLPPPGKPGAFSPAMYPTSVICGVAIEAITTTTKTYTASTKATTTAHRVTNTITSTVTATATVASTLPPNLITSTTTTTTVATTTTTTLTTSTETATQTVVAPTPTTYAACAANNVVSYANGNLPIYGVGNEQSTTFSGSDAPDATTCCIRCQQTDNCVGFGTPYSGYCYIFTRSGECNGALTYGTTFQTRPDYHGFPYTVGNGNCGGILDTGTFDGYTG